MSEENEIISTKFGGKTYYYFPPEQIKRCAYIIAIYPLDNFLKNGGEYLFTGVYYIPKIYDGEPTGETCALLGIKREYVSELFNDQSIFMNQLRTSIDLQYIPGIKELSTKYISNSLSKFINCFDACDKSNIILFNIEPKGEGYLSRSYPEARITIPGGTMEKNDNMDYQVCAYREFFEETGITIPNNVLEIHKEKLRKIIRRKKRFKHFKSKFDFNTSKEFTQIISTIFMLKF